MIPLLTMSPGFGRTGFGRENFPRISTIHPAYIHLIPLLSHYQQLYVGVLHYSLVTAKVPRQSRQAPARRRRIRDVGAGAMRAVRRATEKAHHLGRRPSDRGLYGEMLGKSTEPPIVDGENTPTIRDIIV